MAKEVKANVSMPFAVDSDEQGNAKSAPAEAPPETEKKTRRKRRAKVAEAKTFVVAGKNGTSVCDEDGLIEVLKGYKGSTPEIFVVGAKVKSVSVIPGRRNLLTDESEKDTLEITYE